MARFGNTIVSKSMLTPSQHEEMTREMATRYPDVCSRVDRLVDQIREVIARHDPLSILSQAVWSYAAAQVTKKKGSDDDARAYRLIDYVQSVVVSTPPMSAQTTLDEAGFKKLESLVHELYDILTLEYHICSSAHHRQHDPAYSEDLDALFTELQMNWVAIRGDRHQVHEIVRLNELLTPHSAILTDLFGITAEELVTGVASILHSLTFGFGTVFVDLHRMHEEWCAEADRLFSQNSDKVPDPLLVFKDDPVWKQRAESVAGRMSGGDLFDLQKVCSLPQGLLEALAFEPGQDTEFFSAGPFRGWPLRVLPVWKRPFLKVGGRIYCFDVHGLMDHFYRVIERLVVQRRPSYREEWNAKQKEVSEALPLEYLTRLLPAGTQVWRNLFYDVPRVGIGKAQRCESDAILVVDDRLLVVEVKAGGFVSTPPATDFTAYKNSLKELVQKPTNQALRVIETLELQGDLTFFEKPQGGVPVITLKRGDYHSITAVALTLDTFTHLTAQAQHLQSVGVHLKSRPVWIVGLDDLRTCADVLHVPFQFLHFLEERKKGSVSRAVEVQDEQMHLGLYLERKSYVAHLEQYGDDVWVMPVLFDAKIDEYYKARLETPEVATPPGPKIPDRILEMLRILDQGAKAGRCRAALILHDMDRPAMESLDSDIRSALDLKQALPPRCGRARAGRDRGETSEGSAEPRFASQWPLRT